MTWKNALLGLASVAILFSIYTSWQKYIAQPEPEPASVLARVKETGIIKCGYWVFEPYITRDVNTGKIGGMTADYLEKIAARSGLKIEWAQELSFEQMVPALNYDRIDMFCVPCNPPPEYRKVLDFAGSFGSLPYYVYVPFSSTISKEELETARFAAGESYVPIKLTPEKFPKAKLISLPQMASIAEIYEQLKYGKADAVLNEDITAQGYMKNNPNTIRRWSDDPVEIKEMVFALKKDDDAWSKFVQQMTNTNLPENKNLFRTLIKKYGLTEKAILF